MYLVKKPEFPYKPRLKRCWYCGKKLYGNHHKDKWRAKITVNKKQIHLGLFMDIDDAISARIKAESLYLQ